MSAPSIPPPAASRGTEGGPPAAPEAAGTKRPWSFLDWLPWEKILIWGLFFLAVYTLRHFFFIIFMTFMLTYMMRSSVRRVARFMLPSRENVWLERVLSLAGFALLLFGLYAGGSYLAPKLYRQGEALFKRVTLIEPDKDLKDFATKTVGAILFRRKYGGPDDPRYQEEFRKFQEGKGANEGDYDSFAALVNVLERAFEEDESQKVKSRLAEKSREKDFEDWFIQQKAPELYEKDREVLIKRWEKRYEDAAAFAALPSLDEQRNKLDYEKYRDRSIKEMILRDLGRTGQAYENLRADWVGYYVKSAIAALKASPQYGVRFREFYKRIKSEEPPSVPLPQGKLPYEFEKYVELADAHRRGVEAFSRAFQELTPVSEEERLAQVRANFEREQMTAFLATDWSKSAVYQRFSTILTEYIEAGLKSLAGWIQRTVFYLGTLPIQLALSLLLSLFITLDMPRIRRGIVSLRESRIRDFYAEIAPGLYNFGRLIGRAFQAQGVIALFNTVLTFVAIRYLGIENEIFLCGIVFLCSFIPVLGVVLSSVPIAIMSIVQPGGSIWLALQAIAAILVIHLIETSVLNPKILGDMLHLHPVLVLAVLAIGEHFFGVWGLLLGVPVSVYILRCVILNEEIPGLIEQDPLARVSASLRTAGAQPSQGRPGDRGVEPVHRAAQEKAAAALMPERAAGEGMEAHTETSGPVSAR